MGKLGIILAFLLLAATSAVAQNATKISSLPPTTTPLTGPELFYVVQGGVSKNMTFSALVASIGGGTGTVTSVGFTGGLISVATPTTTPALTVAGTSGGIPYFSSASTWASSAALTAGEIVLGGGAGASPTPLAFGTANQCLTTNSGATALAWAACVTSVGLTFTGGLISVAGSPITSAGTFALTIAGTSGGIPYFSSSSTWASSAALAANALVIGGGAGVAPSTVTVGSGLSLSGGALILGDTGLTYTSPGVMALGNGSVQGSLTIGGTVGGAFALQPPAYTVKTLDQSQASGGTTLLAFANVTSLSVGNIVTGTNIPLGDQIAAINSNAQATFTSNGTAASGQKVIPSILTNNCKVGQQVVDTTTPAAIGPGNVIASIQGSVSYTMTANLAANAGNGDSFTCDPTVTLQQATTAALSSGATVDFTAQFTSLSASSSSYNPGDESILGNINLGGQINFGPGANSGTLRIFSNGSVGLGLNALTGVVTPPANNTAIGFETLLSASLTGQGNTAIGAAALAVNTTGVGNVAVGVTALQHHLTGNNNVGIGNLALGTDTSGVNNTCVGDGACESTTGSELTAFGENALGVETTGNNNTAIGEGALQTITTGQNNTQLGQSASGAPGITTGSNNLLLGAQISGLAAGLTDAIVIATGEGTIRADFGNTTSGQWTFSSALGVTGAAAIVTTNQISYGGTTAAASNCNVASPTPTACVVINVAGTTHYIPYY